MTTTSVLINDTFVGPAWSGDFEQLLLPWATVTTSDDAHGVITATGAPTVTDTQKTQTTLGDTCFIGAWATSFEHEVIDSEIDLDFVSASITAAAELMIVARWNGDNLNPTAYAWVVSNKRNHWWLFKIMGGEWTVLAQGAVTPLTTTKMKFRVIGNNLAMKVWEPTDDEPAWGAGLTDASITAGGRSGIAGAFAATGQTIIVDNVEVLSLDDLPAEQGDPFRTRREYSIDKWTPDTQRYIVEQEHSRNIQALLAYGEYVIWFLLWTDGDFRQGLVGYCQRCMVNDPIAVETYKQPTQNKCPDCFGTGYEGGFRARLVRPSLWVESDEEQIQHSRRGELRVDSHQVQTSSDFTTHNGDIIVRADNGRYRVTSVPQAPKLLTGFGYRDKREAFIGYNIPTATLDQPTTVAYLIPPTNKTEVQRLLTLPNYPRRPVDFSDFEIVRGPLLRP